eukprot:s1045_g12.t1
MACVKLLPLRALDVVLNALASSIFLLLAVSIQWFNEERSAKIEVLLTRGLEDCKRLVIKAPIEQSCGLQPTAVAMWERPQGTPPEAWHSNHAGHHAAEELSHRFEADHSQQLHLMDALSQSDHDAGIGASRPVRLEQADPPALRPAIAGVQQMGLDAEMRQDLLDEFLSFRTIITAKHQEILHSFDLLTQKMKDAAS